MKKFGKNERGGMVNDRETGRKWEGGRYLQRVWMGGRKNGKKKKDEQTHKKLQNVCTQRDLDFV